MSFIGRIFSIIVIAISGFLFGSSSTPQIQAPNTTSSVEIHASTSLRTIPIKSPPVSENQIQPTKTDNTKTSQVNPPPTTLNVSEPTTTPNSTPPTPTSTPSPTPTPPPNSTLCNGTYYSACPTGENFVCPPSGGAYCETNQQQQQEQAAAAQQQKTDQINALTSQYKTQLNALNQQILNIKTQYYSDLAANASNPIPLEFQQGRAQQLLTNANNQISQIQLQEQQLYINYESQLNAL